MGIREHIQSTYQSLELELRIAGGVVYNEAASVSVTLSWDQPANQATITMPTRYATIEEGVAVEIWAGYNGERVLVFKGQFSGIAWDYAPGMVALDARDVMSRTLLKWAGPDRVYTSQDDAAVIVNLLEAMGINEHNIESTGWTLGVYQDVVLKTNETPWSLIQRIDEAAGMRTVCGPNGVVYRRRASGAPGLSAAWNFAQGEDIITVKRARGTDGATNQYTVKGLTYEGVTVTAEASAPNIYLDALVPPELRPFYVSKEFASDLIETDGKATEVAQRLVADFNRRPESLQIETVFNPLLQPGMTIGAAAAAVEAGYALAVVADVRHTIGDGQARTVLTTTAGTLSGYNAAAPIAQFDAKVFRETHVTSGSPATIYEVIADGSSSFDPDGPEDTMTFAWSVSLDAGTATPTTSTDRTFRFVVSGAATEATITLTLTDQDGLTGTSTRVIPIDDETASLEDLYTAEGTVVALTLDGATTWIEETVPGGALATCLMDRAPAWGYVWGASNGHVYATFDNLATLIDLGQPNGSDAVTSIWVHELYDTRIWVGHASGQVSFGLLDLDAQTVSWSVRGSVNAGPVTDIAESYGQLDEVRAMSDDEYSISRDGGASWTMITAGDTAWRMTAGWDRNFAGFLNDPLPLREESSQDVTLPALSPAIEHIRGLAMGWRQRELYLTDDQARLLISTDLATASHTGTAHGAANHLIRSGNVDGIVYLAVGDGTGFNGVEKSVRMAGTPYKIRDTGSRKVYMVGYGGAHSPAPPIVAATIYWPTNGTTPSGVWKYDIETATWSLLTTGLPTGVNWLWIAASPLDGTKLLLLGNKGGDPDAFTFDAGGDNVVMAGGGDITPLWLSEDGGASWTGVTLPVHAGAVGVNGLRTVEWSKTDPDGWSLGCRVHLPSFEFRAGLWRNGAALLSSWTSSSGALTVPGTDGDTVVLSGSRFGYVTAAGTFTLVNSDFGAGSIYPESFPGVTRAIVAPGTTGRTFASIDYRGAPMTERTGGVYEALVNLFHVSVDAQGRVYISDATSGLRRVSNFFSSPTVESVGTGPFGTIPRTDRQTRTHVVARSGAANLLYSADGTTWQIISGPGGTAWANSVEVVAP